MTKFPQLVQAALLFDDENPIDMAALAQGFLSGEALNGISYTIGVDSNPGIFYRLYSTHGVMVSLEYVPGKAQDNVFEGALSSFFTSMTTPDARERIARHRSHVLVGVQHGAIPLNSKLMEFMQKLEVSPAENTLPGYKQRLALCGQITQQANRMGGPSLIHWAVTNHLLPGSAFAGLVDQAAPSLLHFHPVIYEGGLDAAGEQKAGFMTYGAANFIGREVHVLPSTVQLPAVLEALTIFLKIDALEEGYITPEVKEFGPDDNAYRYRIRHVPEGGKSGKYTGPLYELELVHWRGVAPVTPDDIGHKQTFDDRLGQRDVENSDGVAFRAFQETSRVVPSVVKNPSEPRQPSIAMEWRAKRMMAEAAAGSAEVSTDVPLPGAALPAGHSLWGWLPFGRRSTRH